MKNNNSLKEIAALLEKGENIVVFCHVRPDGDAMGSALALTLALKNAGKNAFAVCEDVPPEKLNFIEQMHYFQSNLPEISLDTLISVDCADVFRMGKFSEQYIRFKGNTINIDHHISNNGYGKANYVYDCSATCELLPEILSEAHLEITEEIANLIMLGLITDSGNFAHQDVTEKTFAVAAELRAKGADVNFLNYNLFSKQPKARALLYGRVLDKMRFANGDSICFLTITQADLQITGADKSMTEGFVDFPLTIEGVEVSVALMEVKPNQYKTSLRSKGKANVNAVASQFGGGGHILASGCMLFGEYEEVIERLTYAIYQNL